MQWLKSLWGRRDLANAALATIGGLCLAVGGNAIYGMFAGFGLTDLLIAVVALILAFILFNLLIPLLRRPARFKASQYTETVRPRAALITMVSLPSDRENVAEAALRHHRGSGGAGSHTLKYCWLLYTHNADPSQSSEPEAVRIQQKYADLDCRLVRLADGAEGKPKRVYKAVKQAYEEAVGLGIPSHEVIADATGGTKAMTIGMDLACRELRITLECITPHYRNNRPVPGTERFIAIDTTGIGIPLESVSAAESSVATAQEPPVADNTSSAISS